MYYILSGKINSVLRYVYQIPATTKIIVTEAILLEILRLFGRASDRKVAGLMPVLGISSLCPWERHLTLIS